MATLNKNITQWASVSDLYFKIQWNNIVKQYHLKQHIKCHSKTTEAGLANINKLLTLVQNRLLKICTHF